MTLKLIHESQMLQTCYLLYIQYSSKAHGAAARQASRGWPIRRKGDLGKGTLKTEELKQPEDQSELSDTKKSQSNIYETKCIRIKIWSSDGPLQGILFMAKWQIDIQ